MKRIGLIVSLVLPACGAGAAEGPGVDVKVLYGFENAEGERYIVEDPSPESAGRSRITVSAEHATEGKRSLRLDSVSPRGSVRFSGFEPDWTAYDSLAIDIYNASDKPLAVTAWVQSGTKAGGWGRNERYLVLRPGFNCLRILTRELTDLSDIAAFSVAVGNQTIFLDNIRLVKGKEISSLPDATAPAPLPEAERAEYLAGGWGNKECDRLFEGGQSEYRDKLPFRLLTPERVEPGKTYPLVLVLPAHQAGGVPESQLLVRGAAAEFAKPEIRQKNPCFVIVPMCGPRLGLTVPTLALVDRLLAELPIDMGRIYVTGHSEGGTNTWNAIQSRPELFAAAIPIFGGGDKKQAPKLKDVQVWAFHGEHGRKGYSVRPDSDAAAMAEAIRKAGGTAKVTIYPGVGPECWAQAYADPEVLAWLFAQRKENPVAAPGRPGASPRPAGAGGGPASAEPWLDLYEPRESEYDTRMSYWLLKPEKLEPGKTYPLVLTLHGGEWGTGYLARKHIVAGGKLVDPEIRRKYPCFALAPFDFGGQFRRREATLDLIEKLARELPIDKDRIYVLGHSSGGIATWNFIMHRPESFAAAVPFCGWFARGSIERAPKLANLSIWAFQGTNDGVFSHKGTVQMIEAIRKAGGTPRMTIIEGGDHCCNVPGLADPELWPWLFAQKK